MSVLRNGNFRLFWTGQMISLVGTWMQALAQSWVVMSLAHTAFALGLLNFASAVPPALLMLHGGVAADKMDKRRILIVTQAIFMAGAFAMAALVRSGEIRLWHVMTLAIALGFAVAFDLPANQALTPELVERNDIPAAVQLNQAIFHGSRMVGPGLAGWLIGRYGPYSAFVANGVSFIPVILTLLVVRPVRAVEGRPAGSILEAMHEGLAYVRTHPRVGAMLGLTAITTTIIFPNMIVLMPYYIKNVLGLGAKVLGSSMSSGGAGAFFGALSLLLVPDDRRMNRIALGLAGLTASLLCLGIIPRLGLGPVAVVPAVCASAALLGFSMSSSGGLIATILQQEVPDQLRGRVMSLQSLVFIGLMPFAGLIISAVADVVTLPHEMLASAALFGVLATVLFLRLSEHSATEVRRAP